MAGEAWVGDFEQEEGEMTSLEKVQDILKRLTYKPNWIITAHSSITPWERDNVVLTIGVRVMDVDTGKPTVIHESTVIESYFLPNEDSGIVEIISGAIRHIEEHEFREWLKFDGICVRNPHPERNTI
jgi:hypothetical protein